MSSGRREASGRGKGTWAGEFFLGGGLGFRVEGLGGVAGCQRAFGGLCRRIWGHRTALASSAGV